MEDLIKFSKENRKEFHQVPEIGFTEYITTYLIYEKISQTKFDIFIGDDALSTEDRLGIPSHDILEKSYKRALNYGVPKDFLNKIHPGKTGLVAKLDTKKSGPHTVLRFDIDGLPIEENESQTHIPFTEKFISKHKGEMHACGHDAHIAIGISIATYISQHINELCGKYTIIFQSAEEGVRGAKCYTKKGWLSDADYFFSSHVGIVSEKVGTVAATTSNFLASSKFDVELYGKSSHAAANPQDGLNTLLAASTIALSLNGIPQHRDGLTRLNVGTLHAGQGRNIIPDYAKLECETRGATSELNNFMFNRAKEIIEHGAKMYGCDSKITIQGHAPSASCSKEMIQMIKESNKDNKNVINIIDEIAMDASEDATVYMNEVQDKGGKATYLLFPYELKYGHHHPQFDIDESVLSVAVTTFINILNNLK